LLAERGEVLRGAAKVEIQLGLKVSDRPLPVKKEFEDSDPPGIVDSPEKLTPDYVGGIAHARHRGAKGREVRVSSLTGGRHQA
jgi:hypothetical protein